MSGVATASGARLYIGTTAADQATDSFTEVGEVMDIPAFGRKYGEIKYAPLNTRGVQKFKSNYDDGSITVTLGKDINDDGQAALNDALDVDADYNIKIVDNDDVPATSADVTISDSTDAVTDTAHGFAVGTAVKFATTGTLPDGLAAGTTYYIVDVVDTDSYKVSATKGGSAINFPASPAQSGTHTRTTVPAGSYQIFKAKVMSFMTVRGDGTDVVKVQVDLSIKSGTLTEQVHLP
jgi:hypothetical protein